ncbi:GAF domain-containing sensor histidine kinase [Pseudalkalibacillus decolorationis]|uniref:GAF domain-containing sensor histidine kinase n=1 Tax=Pseudalkalibacillus decolorationis TaxID=163879 RepID=UPI00214874F7|nr:GAF domain-containing sensor histidine kinase [Pseudalkalibacillus decolorationis]
MNISSRVKKEQNSNRILTLFSIIGWFLILYSLIQFNPSGNDIWTPLVLVIFLLVTKLFPIPVWRGVSSLSFPLVYTIVILYGIWSGILICSVVSLIVNIFVKRPQRAVWFNPAQLSISLCSAYFLTFWAIRYLDVYLTGNLVFNFSHAALFIVTFYLINNLLNDIILWLRPHPYRWVDWKEKTAQESIIVLVSYCYIGTMFVLGSQNRGVVDVFSYLFFFSPLVALAIISAIISRLKREKNRLKALFSITRELNRKLASADWSDNVELSLQEFIPTDALLLMVKEENEWSSLIKVGGISSKPEQLIDHGWFEELEESYHYSFGKQLPSELKRLVHPSICSVVVTPLRIEEEVLGVIVVGKTTNQSYQVSDLQFISTLSNQVAVILKTRMLYSEREKRVLLEERNRIAREIHDGIAQTLAGAIMKLETSNRILGTNKDQSGKLVEDSIMKLRDSLSEVRESIYALRPYPTVKEGFKQAIQSKINEIIHLYQIPIALQVRGNIRTLPSHIEKNSFEILSEALHNAGKHSNASELKVVLKYGSNALILKVKDNGKGFQLYDALVKAKADAHYGILNMNELAEQIDASLRINSVAERGTEILLIVPLSQENERMLSHD